MGWSGIFCIFAVSLIAQRAHGNARQFMKRVLVITYYWPPSGGSGVQRWVKFAKYLPSEGWETVIYTPENPEAPGIDRTLEADIPEGTEVIKTHISEIYGIYRKFSKGGSGQVNPINQQRKNLKQKIAMWVRGNLFIPDPRIGWVGPSIRFLKKYLKEHPVDVIVSTGPPHSMHLIARGVAKATGIPWIADFRDPWTKLFYFKHLQLSESSLKKHRELEQQVLDDATVVVAVSPLVKEEFEAMTKTPVRLVTNGFDPEDFVPVSAALKEGTGAEREDSVTEEAAKEVAKKSLRGNGADPEGEERIEKEGGAGRGGYDKGEGRKRGAVEGCFELVHTGLFAIDGNPERLWKVLRNKCLEDEEFSRRMRIVLAGKTDGGVLASIADAGLRDNLVDLGYRSHKDVVRLQKEAGVLLLPLRKEPEYRATLPGKLFEYLGARRPVLGIGQTDGAMARVLSETASGRTFEWNDETGLRQYIDNCWESFKAGKLEVPDRDISRYSRPATARQMAQLFDSLI